MKLVVRETGYFPIKSATRDADSATQNFRRGQPQGNMETDIWSRYKMKVIIRKIVVFSRSNDPKIPVRCSRGGEDCQPLRAARETREIRRRDARVAGIIVWKSSCHRACCNNFASTRISLSQDTTISEMSNQMV